MKITKSMKGIVLMSCPLQLVIPVVQSPWTGTWQILKCGHYQKVQLWVQQ